MKKKTALIFGVTGQDGAYLSRFLLSKGYLVHGVKRRSSSLNTSRIDDIYEDVNNAKNFILHYGDITDSLNVFNLIKNIKPNEIYNLSAQSHVGVSFFQPEYTSNVNGIGTLRILDSIKTLKFFKTKYYQAGTSEMFGASPPKQNENTKFYPRSPYAAAKLFAHWITINYREAYGIFACNGILFNHESPIRGETFVTKKIISGLCKIKKGSSNPIYLGNIYSKRDWGHAKDYVEAMWLMLQKKTPDDYVIATGKSMTVKNFINLSAKKLGLKISWSGKGLNETAKINGKKLIIISKRYFRPSEVDNLQGDARKSQKILKWKPKINIDKLIEDMINFEMQV